MITGPGRTIRLSAYAEALRPPAADIPEGKVAIPCPAFEDRRLSAKAAGILVKARIPPELRMAVLRRDGFRCVACDADEDLMADHVIPESLGGPTTFDNLQTMCRPCNSHKGTKAAMPE